MSKKNNNPESKNDKNTDSASFELLNTDADVLSSYMAEGFSIRALNPSLWLPTTIGSFVRFLIVIAILVLGSTVNIYISAQISEAQLEQIVLEEEYISIQRQNAQITWQIAQHTSLDQIRQRAVNIGYIGAPNRSYAFSPISEDTLAVLDATILPEVGAGATTRQTTAQNRLDAQLAVYSNPEVLEETLSEQALSEEESQQSPAIVAAANLSANRLIENGLLEAIKVIDGR